MSTKAVSNILEKFDTIRLEEMNDVQLMNRVDTKFVFSIDQLINILPDLVKDYRVLEVNNELLSEYHSMYYDDPELFMYKNHHRKRVDRFKIRFRKYMNSGIAFLEVKHKHKGRTEKFRIPANDIPESMDESELKFVNDQGVDRDNLIPTLGNNFKRITLVNKHSKERLTLDIELTFEWNKHTSNMHELVIAELKQEQRDRTSPFYALMKKDLIRPFRISKYCIGIITTRDLKDVKYNRFKKKLIKIDKINSHAA